MSNPNIQDILTSPRAQAELERLQSALNERNQQLHLTEHQLTNTQINYKQAHKNMCLLMAFCTLVAFAMVLGGLA